MYDDVFSDGIGEESELAQPAEPSTTVEDATDAFEVNESSPDVAEIQEPTDQVPATAPDEGAQESQGEDAQQTASDDELEKLEKEVEEALSDSRTPKWFKNAVESVYKPKLNSLGAQVDKYSAYGTPEEISGKLGMIDKLGEIRTDPNTRMPIRSTEGFVQELYEKDPEVAQQLMADLARLPAPDGSGQTVIQALFNNLGIDPNRLNDVQKFAQAGYQLQATQFAPPDPDDLAEIPENLRATFSNLPPEVRDSLMSDVEFVRNQNLEAHRYRMEAEERTRTEEASKVQNDAYQKQQQQAQFIQQVDAKSVEYFEKSGETVLNTFVDSLAKQAGMSQFDALVVSNTLLNALEPTLAGRKTQEALKAEGIEIDPAIPTAIDKLNELSRHAAYYELIGDKESVKNVVADIAEINERIVAKSNKVIAQLAKKRNGQSVAKAVGQSNALNNTKNDRHALTGSPLGDGSSRNGGSRTPMDFSDEAYMEELRQQGFR